MPPNSELETLSTAERLSLNLSASAAGFYLGPMDAVQVSSLASVATTITITGALLGLDGLVRPVTFDHVANTNRTLATTTYKVGEGWLLQLTARVSSGAPIIGQAWARVQVVRGDNAGAFVLATLGARYVTSVQPIAWPGGDTRSSVEGRGAMRSIAGTDPAAGAEVLETVPTGAVWRLVAIRATLVTDATVASRTSRLRIDDGTTDLFFIDPPASQTASLSFEYTGAAGVQRAAIVSNVAIWPLPIDLFLRPGYRIRTSTSSLQAGDNFGAPQLLVEEWLEGA